VREARLIDHLVPEMQRRLVERGFIERPEDLFFLASHEVVDALEGQGPPAYRDVVTRRRREYERNRHVLLPERFHGRPAPLSPEEAGHSGDVLVGTPVSAGSVTGRARVIIDPREDGHIEPGEILVAPVTDAGWTPLFALASGLCGRHGERAQPRQHRGARIRAAGSRERAPRDARDQDRRPYRGQRVEGDCDNPRGRRELMGATGP